MAHAICPVCRAPHRHLGRTNPLRVLAVTPRTIASTVRRIPARRLGRRPSALGWSVVEVLSHLLDAEVTLGFRIRKAAAEPGSLMVAWDQQKWTEGLRNRRADARSTLAAFAALRAVNLALVRRLSPAQRRHRGRHPEYGPIRVDQMVEHFAEHDLSHLNQIRETWRSLAGRR